MTTVLTLHRELTLILLLLVGYSYAYSADSTETEQNKTDYTRGLVFGENYAYYLVPPAGWERDENPLVRLNWNSAFYPQEYSDSTSPVIIYSIVLFKDESMKSGDILEAYTAGYKTSFANLRIKDRDAIITAHDDTLQVRLHWSPESHLFQLIAIHELEDKAVLVIFQARTSKSFNKYEAKLEEMMKSYQYLTDNVRMSYPSDSTDD